jgi:hypothetical protein
VKAVDRCANHGPAQPGDDGRQFVSKRCLAGGVDSIDRHANRMRPSDRCDPGRQIFDELLTLHAVPRDVRPSPIPCGKLHLDLPQLLSP